MRGLFKREVVPSPEFVELVEALGRRMQDFDAAVPPELADLRICQDVADDILYEAGVFDDEPQDNEVCCNQS